MQNPQRPAWGELTSFLHTHFHEPDVEGLEVVLSVATSHYFVADPPVWLFVCGPPASGKTTIYVEPLTGLPRVQRVDDLSPKTLLSGYGKGYGLLDSLGGDGKHGIILFPDFNTLVSLREDDKRQIAGQLRRVFDGHLDKDVGSQKKKLTWDGKATVIAAITEEGERQWGLMRSLGERFLTIRVRRGDVIQAALKSMRGNHSVAIKQKLAQLVVKAIDLGTLKPSVGVIDDEDQVVALAEILARARGHVLRDSRGSREVIYTPEPEAPTRISYSLARVALSHSALFRHSELEEDDTRIIKRLALDSIPPTRRSVLESIRASPGTITLADMERQTRRPRSTLEWALDEMRALEIVENAAGTGNTYQFTKEFRDRMIEAKLISSTVVPLKVVKVAATTWSLDD